MDYSRCEKDNFVNMCMSMFKFQTEDEWVVKFRQMLIIEQFKNPEISKIYKELFIDMPINNQAKVFENLMEANIIKRNNAVVMAMELYSPFFMLHTVRDKYNYEKLLKEHTKNFMKIYLN
ncbi:hypothetical protein ACTNDG_03915 [Clostridium sp. HCP1S3_B4]|uniref:hypothetical protein n=2 Tax=Clostridium TaxID=1485 RepID=UPI0016BAFE72|nr:hypothetical protein [Clostridiales bacterium]MDY2730346.1 hypothetical protein [Clostridium sp.]NLK24204.1 hypothetical protein [Clostridiales bacterium]